MFLLSTAQVPDLGQDCWWAGRWAEHWATAWAEDGGTGEAGVMGEAGGMEEAGEVCNSMSQATSLSRLHCNKIPFMYFIPFRGIARPQSQFPHSCFCEWFIYSQDGSNIFCSRIGRSMWEYLNRSQTHECGNWDCGRAIPFLGIFVSNFWYWLQCRYCVYRKVE